MWSRKSEQMAWERDYILNIKASTIEKNKKSRCKKNVLLIHELLGETCSETSRQWVQDHDHPILTMDAPEC